MLEFQWLKLARPERMVEESSEVERDETSRKVREAVTKLPVRDREVIVLYYLEEWPVARIGEALGVKVGAIDVRLHRAREKLRSLLEKEVYKR